MKLRTVIGLVFVISLFFSCTANVQRLNKERGYDTAAYAMYLVDLKDRYKEYRFDIDNQVERPIEFITLYSTSCFHNKSKIGEEYLLINTCDVYGKINGKEENLCYLELLLFNQDSYIDSIVTKIRKNNCIDPYNLKLHRVYKFGRRMALFANFYPTFDIVSFEDFLASEFNGILSVEIINSSR